MVRVRVGFIGVVGGSIGWEVVVVWLGGGGMGGNSSRSSEKLGGELGWESGFGFVRGSLRIAGSVVGLMNY